MCESRKNTSSYPFGSNTGRAGGGVRARGGSVSVNYLIDRLVGMEHQPLALAP